MEFLFVLLGDPKRPKFLLVYRLLVACANPAIISRDHCIERGLMRLILASSSPRRRQLLSQLGLHFQIIKPAIDESQRTDELPHAYAERLSREKAEAVAASLADEAALVLAADTIVIAEAGDLLGKPGDAAQARAMLRRLRGTAHQVVTAFTLHRQAPRHIITRQVRTIVNMRDYSDAEIEAYINSGDPFDKAGAYAIQNEAFAPVASIEGSYSNVVGLPLEEVKAALREIGYPLPETP